MNEYFPQYYKMLDLKTMSKSQPLRLVLAKCLDNMESASQVTLKKCIHI